MRKITIVLSMLLTFPAMADEYLGKLSENPYNPDSTSNEHCQHGSKYSNDSAKNPYGEGLSIYSDDNN